MWAVRRLLEHLARKQPLVIAFDDLQWAEPTFLDLIEYLLGWIRDAPILIVCLARPDLLEQHPGWLATAANASAITLDPLSEDEAESLLELLRGETELTDLFTRITEAAEGNPLYVEQMLAMLTENGNGSAKRDFAIPPTIHALLAARLDRLEPQERAVIERASVIGKEFWRGAVAELTPARAGKRPTSPDDAGAEFIEPGASIFPEEDGFRFRHILIRDAAYLGMPKETRAELHERYADWLERTTGPKASSTRSWATTSSRRMATGRSSGRSASLPRCWRLEQANDSAGRDAVRSLAVATSRRRRACSPALSRFCRTITLCGELLVELASLLMTIGAFERADEIVGDALSTAKAAGDVQLEMRALIEREFFKIFTAQEVSSSVPEVTTRAIPVLEEAVTISAGTGLAIARRGRGVGRALGSPRRGSGACPRARPAGDRPARRSHPRRPARDGALLRADAGRGCDRSLHGPCSQR